MSKMTMVPREMQLHVVLADVHAKDALVAAGTGSGKSLSICSLYLARRPHGQLPLDHHIQFLGGSFEIVEGFDSSGGFVGNSVEKFYG